MDKDMIVTSSHSISISERKTINITGVKKIENFDKEQFLLETVMGFIIVKGEDLELVKLDTLQGNISIKGTVNALYYAEDINKKKEDSIFNRLFK